MDLIILIFCQVLYNICSQYNWKLLWNFNISKLAKKYLNRRLNWRGDY